MVRSTVNTPSNEGADPDKPALNVLVVGPTSGERAPTRLLVLLHGYGADEHDLGPLASHLDPLGDFFTICPRAPFDVPPTGAGWYERAGDGSIDPATFIGSVDAVDVTIDWACAEFGFNRSEAVVIGFSQGGAMTLASALRAGDRPRPAAVACLSGMLTEVDGLEYAFEASDLPRLLIQHGTHDPVVTPERGYRTRDALTENEVEHLFQEYPMQHEITGESIAGLREWLAPATG